MPCVAGHQPNLYPYGGFFAKIASVDRFVIVDNTQYVKKQYQNRNRIRQVNGTVLWLSVPVKNAGRFGQLINEVEIDPRQNWRKIHKNTLSHNYRRAPFFDNFYPEFETFIEREYRLLADFNMAFISMCLRLLNITTPIRIASEAGISGQASELILAICRQTGCDSYLHGKHSMDYVDFSLLERAEIKNLLQEFTAVEYQQTAAGFEPNLSILDLLFNCGTEAKNIILAGNKIVPVA